MKASKCFWVALCLLVGSFSTELWAQKNLEAVVQKCKADKTIDKSVVTNKDPKTKKVYKSLFFRRGGPRRITTRN